MHDDAFGADVGADLFDDAGFSDAGSAMDEDRVFGGNSGRKQRAELRRFDGCNGHDVNTCIGVMERDETHPKPTAPQIAVKSCASVAQRPWLAGSCPRAKGLTDICGVVWPEHRRGKSTGPPCGGDNLRRPPTNTPSLGSGASGRGSAIPAPTPEYRHVSGRLASPLRTRSR